MTVRSGSSTVCKQENAQGSTRVTGTDRSEQIRAGPRYPVGSVHSIDVCSATVGHEQAECAWDEGDSDRVQGEWGQWHLCVVELSRESVADAPWGAGHGGSESDSTYGRWTA